MLRRWETARPMRRVYAVDLLGMGASSRPYIDTGAATVALGK